jgi:hypothetical protein
MPGDQPLPVGAGEGGRPRRTGHGGRFTAREVVLRPTDRGEMPTPPHWLDPRELEVFTELWSKPVAKLWEEFDRGLVALLARLMVKLEDGSDDGGLQSRIASLHGHLYLSPRTRRSAGIRIEHEGEDDNLSPAERWAKRRRERPPEVA